jgi:hypothetical protein
MDKSNEHQKMHDVGVMGCGEMMIPQGTYRGDMIANGSGTIEFSNGVIYRGFFSRGAPVEKGYLRHPDGLIQHGYWNTPGREFVVTDEQIDLKHKEKGND